MLALPNLGARLGIVDLGGLVTPRGEVLAIR